MVPTKHKLVAVEWVDSASWNGWRDSAEVLEHSGPMRCFSMGMLFHEASDHIIIVGTWDEQDPVRLDRPLSIPKGCIRRITEIKWPKKRSKPVKRAQKRK